MSWAGVLVQVKVLILVFGTFIPRNPPVTNGSYVPALGQLRFAYANGQFVEVNSLNPFSFTVSTVHEPSTMLLLDSGIPGLLAWRYHRRQRS